MLIRQVEDCVMVSPVSSIVYNSWRVLFPVDYTTTEDAVLLNGKMQLYLLSCHCSGPSRRINSCFDSDTGPRTTWRPTVGELWKLNSFALS